MRFTILILLVVLLSACAPRPFSPPAECVENPSFVLDAIPNPTALERDLLVINLAALETIKGYTPADAIEVLDQIDGLLDKTDATYLELVSYITQKIGIANALAGSMVFILGDDLDALSSPLTVNVCDVALIRRYLAKQRMLIAIYSNK